MDVVHTQVCLSIEQDVIVAAIIVTDNLSALFPNASAKRNDKLFRSRLRSEYVQSPVARIQWSAFKETNFRILNNRLSYSYLDSWSEEVSYQYLLYHNLAPSPAAATV